MTRKAKSFLSLLLALCMIFSSLPLNVSAAGGTPTAKITNVTVVGVKGQLLNPETIVEITLSKGNFKGEVANITNEDLVKWFKHGSGDISTLGLETKILTQTSTASPNKVEIQISGTPNDVLTEEIRVVIPSGFTDNNVGITTESNKKAKYSITEQAQDAVVTISNQNVEGTVDSDITPTILTISVEHDTFKDIRKEEVKSWFRDIPDNLTANIKEEVRDFSPEITVELTGRPTKADDKNIKVVIPQEKLNKNVSKTTEINPKAKYLIQKKEANVSISGETQKPYGEDNFTLTAQAAQKGTSAQTWAWSVVSGDDVVQIEGATNTDTANVKILKAGTAQLKAVYESDVTKGEKLVDLTIAKKDLTITGVTAVDREYAEGNIIVALITDSANLQGIVNSDDVTIKADSKKGTIADANAGNAKVVTTKLELDGAKKDNYTLTQPTDVKVNITKAAQRKVTGLTGEAPTVSGGKGKIKGTTDKMEYSTDASFSSPAGTQCTATATAVDPGTYYVRLKGDNNHKPGEVSDEVVVDPYAPSAKPAIELSQRHDIELIFDTKYVGYTPQEKTITITNTDAIKSTGRLNVKLGGTNERDFTVRSDTITDILARGNVTFVVAPKPNLGVGTYKATVSVEGTGIKEPQLFPVKFEVKATPAPQPRDDSDDSSDNDSGSSSSGSSGTVEKITPNKDGKKVEPKKEDSKDSKKPETKKEEQKVIPELNLKISEQTAKKIEKFTDVQPNSWYNDALSYAIERGLMNGLSEKTFAPNEKTTRGQLVEIFYRLAGQPKTDKTQAFGDVSKNAYYNNAVAWASNNNIVKGLGDGNFGSNQNITREQLAVFLYRFAQSQNKNVTVKTDLAKFADNTNVSAWAQDALAWAVANNLVKGVGQDSLDPKGNATRAQIATIMLRYEAMFAPKTSK